MAQSRGSAKAILSIAAIVVAAGVLYWYFGVQVGNNPAIQRDVEVLAIDIETGEAVEVLKKKGETFPLKNPETGEETLWRAYVNYKGKFLFPAKPGTMVTSCPITGDREVGGASIEEHKDYPVEMPQNLQR